MWALEAAMAHRRSAERLGIEGLLAVRANERTFVAGGGLRHGRQASDQRSVRARGGAPSALEALGEERKRCDGSSVVFVGSIAAVRGRDRHAAYAATKAGLLGLTVNLAAELAPRVRINCVCVGATRTSMMEQAVREYVTAVGEAGAQKLWTVETPRLLLGVAEPAQIAASIAFLALDATFSTGTVLYADGGYTAR
jgi:NAD(P)-dependent dehydrogenase (short-subunit alcohol dehydrogenase family)